MRRTLVAQTASLLYRRLPVGQAMYTLAGWQPATQQVGNLRYFANAGSMSDLCAVHASSS